MLILMSLHLFAEDIDNSLGDYFKALAILGHLVEPDHRRIVELYPPCGNNNVIVCHVVV